MESGIDYKGLLFAYDENSLSIYAFQGESVKVSLSTAFSGTDFGVKFIDWRGDLYALIDDGRLLKLLNMVPGSEDNWTEVCDASESVADMINFEDTIYIIGKTNIYSWNGSVLSSKVALPSGYEYYCALSVEDSIYLYGDDGTYTTVTKYDGNITFTDIWQDTTSGPVIDYSFYNKEGKPHLVEFEGKLYFTYHYNLTYTYLIEYDLTTNKYGAISGITSQNITGVNTSMIIDNDMILLAVFESSPSIDNSNVYVHVLKDYKQEEYLPSGSGHKSGHLYRVDSDPIMPSHNDKERLVYYPIYTVIGHVGGNLQPVFKYGNRLECYTDLNDVDSLLNVNLKDVVDDLCNLLDSYLFIRPTNIAEVDVKGMVGRSDRLFTLSDDKDYGDIHIISLDDYSQGHNNFRRISIDWENPVWGSGVEFVGVSDILNVNEYSFSSFLINTPLLAKNLANYMFNNMFSSDVIVFTCEYSPFVRVNDNVNVKAISSYLYIDENREYKVVQVQHSWDKKTSQISIAQRNLIYKSLEI